MIVLPLKYPCFMNDLTNKQRIRAAIIEDELPAARLLQGMLAELRPQWEILLLPGTVEEAVQWFAGHPHPDILFLDIQLTDGLSFYFIEQARPESMIVFTTAYDEYAVRAFTVNSIDYLLKPIHRERLADAIQKFERLTAPRIHELNSRIDVQELIQALADRNTRRYRTRFLISGPRSLYTLNVDEVCYFYSEEKITFAVTADRRTHIIDLPLAKLEEQLDPQQFFRVNRQYILSAPCIRDIEPYFNGKVVVHVVPATDSPIQVSREKVAALKMWLNY